MGKPDNTVTACAPGKIILSGEHAVVYGSPVLAMAVNCSITVSITPGLGNNIYFKFVDSIIKT
jgi:mevalonate kinase